MRPVRLFVLLGCQSSKWIGAASERCAAACGHRDHRPQDAPGAFTEEHDTWYFARVAGTFKERQGFHGCQMPERLLGRIIRTSSNPRDVVMDPFSWPLR